MDNMEVENSQVAGPSGTQPATNLKRSFREVLRYFVLKDDTSPHPKRSNVNPSDVFTITDTIRVEV